MSVSLSALEDIVYAILREESTDSTSYPLVLIDLLLNAAQQDICGGRVIHPITGEEARAGDLHFLNTDAYYSNVQMTYTTADMAINAGTIYADTTDYPTTGKLYIGGQVVPYTGITTTTFTGVTGILFAYTSGTPISICYALPTDYSDIKEVIYNNVYKLPGKIYDEMYNDLDSYKGSNLQRNTTTNTNSYKLTVSPYYTIKDAAYLIIFGLNETGGMIHLRYEKTPATMITTGTPVGATIDNDIYAKMTIAYIATAMLMFERGEELRGAQIYNNAIKNVRKMYSWYNDSVLESQTGKVYKTGHGHINI